MKKITYPCILYVGTFPPRECGIATFTQDLTNAMDKQFSPRIKSRILAINDNHTVMYNYPPKVAIQIREDDMEDYLTMAEDINRSSGVKLVNIQHEYGIFGGNKGSYILPFMELLKKPIVITMHTVLPQPDDKLRKITRDLVAKARGVVVMTGKAAAILEHQYGIKKNKIYIIPHGVHHVAFPSKTKAKKKLHLTGKIVLTTFGMLSRDKGVEYIIRALPRVVKKYPNVLYIILGVTHPQVRKLEGEEYRNKLKNIIARLNLEHNVKFYDKYLALPELIEFLKATDIYLSASLNPGQAVSGTISYALSCACPVIATRIQYAKEVISRQCGILVGFKNYKANEKAILKILADDKARSEMRKSAYYVSRPMTWQNVALSYFKTFNNFAKIMPREKDKLPVMNFNHLKNLTDDFGIIQFANHTKPDPNSGYCLDDNSRALLVSLMIYQNQPTPKILALIDIYLKFIRFVQKANGQFYNFVSYQKTFIDKSTSEDSIGRTIWALGYLLTLNNLPNNLARSARTILKKCLNNLSKLQSCRAIALAIIGLSYAYGSTVGASSAENKTAGDNYLKLIKFLANKLVARYKKQIAEPKNRAKKWFWFENYLTYSNYKLPEALLFAYEATEDRQYLKIAENSLKFLMPISFEKSYFSPIGQNGWYFRDGQRAYFDQQPEDASTTVEALTKAYEITGKAGYAKQARIAFEWFLGENDLNQMVYDEATGGCYDGLGKNSINFNQGAESTISYLLARLAMEKIK